MTAMKVQVTILAAAPLRGSAACELDGVLSCVRSNSSFQAYQLTIGRSTSSKYKLQRNNTCNR